jgi:hypothetical protein
MEYFRVAGRHLERAHLFVSFHFIEEESKRFVAAFCKQTYLAFAYVISEALEASVVKIHGRDVIASWKVLTSLGVASVLYTFYAVLATILVIKTKAPWKWRLLTPPLTIAALPAIGYAALKFGEAGVDVLK